MQTKLALSAVVIAIATWLSAAPAQAQMLSIQGDKLAVNGQQRFLVFVTYFDALDVPDGQLDSDLANLHDAVHIDGIRVFPNWWGQSSRSSGRFSTGNDVMDGGGNIRFDRWIKLLRVLDLARAHGLVVDVSWAHEVVPVNDFNAYVAGLQTVTSMLASSSYDHVLFDLQNEANNNGYGDGEIATLVSAVHGRDGGRIVTVSLDQNRTPGGAASLAAATGQNVVSWHEPRNAASLASAGDINAMRSAGRPAYLQEPPKAEDGGGISAGDFLEAARRAKASGAAAWCYHTSAGQWMDAGSGLNPAGGIWDRITGAAPDSNGTDKEVIVNVRNVVDGQPGPGGGGDVVFYEDINFIGASFSASGDLSFVGWDWNDRISSIHIPPGKTLFIYQDWQFEGAVIALTGDITDLRVFGANDWISSLQIR